jgi:hypothetical protein
VADVCDFAGGTHRSHADPPSGYEVIDQFQEGGAEIAYCGDVIGPLVRLARCDVSDHINCRKNDRWRPYRFYRALQWLKSPTSDICEIFGAPRFRSFSTQSRK